LTNRRVTPRPGLWYQAVSIILVIIENELSIVFAAVRIILY
jgi:hypothetical protein